MDIIKEYVEENKYYLDRLKYEVFDNYILLSPQRFTNSIKLCKKDLVILKSEKLIQDKFNIEYYHHYGFSLDNYGEFFLGGEDSYLYRIYGDTSNIDLKFKIGEIYIEFNRVSPLCILLLEPFYSSKAEYIADRGLEEYFYTLKIFDAPREEHKKILVKALYYLNGHYLIKTGKSLTIFNLIGDETDESFLEYDYESKNVIERRRIRKRKDFISVSPLIFYNDACMQKPENQFLGFYRILEFFFYRALEDQLQIYRNDENITEKEIIKLIQNKDERSLLHNLINKVLTKSDKDRLIKHLLNKKLIKGDTFDKFCNSIYEYRNSIVHSKEAQITNVRIPDIFNENKDFNVWNYVIKYISEATIKRLNHK